MATTRTIDGSGIDRVLREAVESGAVPHVVAIAADRDGVLYEGGAGLPVAGVDGAEVTADTPFRVMSMTKMIATTAALQLVEQGRLDLDTPVDELLPEFGDLQVLDGWDGDTPRLRAPRTRATVRHLVTHTSGLGYWFFSADLGRYEQYAGIPNVVPGDMAAFRAPLLADPGTQFVYGINTDWLGRVVESIAGRTLDVVVKEDITGPLGMDHTAFRMTDEQKTNAVSVHVRSEGGAWSAAGNIIAEDPEWWAGGHGLYSTPRDYIRFERALLRGGELDGVRILSEATVDAAFTNQIGDIDVPAEIPSGDLAITDHFRPGPGWKWGYGLLINTADAPGGRRAGTGAWAGLFNTHFFIDRTTGVCASIYTNSLPFIESGAWQLYGDVEQALYAAL